LPGVTRGVVVTGASTGIGSLRRELLPFGVRVIVIEPGSFKTAIWSKVEAMDLGRYAGTPYQSVLDRFRRAALRGAEQGGSTAFRCGFPTVGSTG